MNRLKKPLMVVMQIGVVFFLYCYIMMYLAKHNLELANIEMKGASIFHNMGATDLCNEYKALSEGHVNKANNIKKWIPSFVISK